MALGVYIHVPFCVSKCPYCDFYSLTGQDEATKEAYTDAVEHRLRFWADKLHTKADTVYFGGGTPSLLGEKRLARLTKVAAEAFHVQGEITMEANPAEDLYTTFAAFAAAGGNRLSMGMQSAVDTELRFLGRRHASSQVVTAVEAAHRAGIRNVSLDMMLGLAHQTEAGIRASAELCQQLNIPHVSGYMLKIEPGTPFARRRETLALPDDDRTAELYLCMVEELAARGYRQYEISNFARPGFESHHNLKYWNSEPYIGIGPSAHSFVNGKRFAYPRDMAAFMAGEEPSAENTAEDVIGENTPAEYAMLRLRLADGLTEADYRQRFGESLPPDWIKRAEKLPAGLLIADKNGIRLTPQGFLVSNAVIEHILDI